MEVPVSALPFHHHDKSMIGRCDDHRVRVNGHSVPGLVLLNHDNSSRTGTKREKSVVRSILDWVERGEHDQQSDETKMSTRRSFLAKVSFRVPSGFKSGFAVSYP